MSQLPATPNLDWLRKQAKRRLDELRTGFPQAQLAHAQFDLAKDFGFRSWRDLKAHVDTLTIDGQMIVAAKNGDAKTLGALLDAHPDKLGLAVPPYEGTLLHAVRGSSPSWAADPHARWAHWDAEVTPLHLACLADHPAVVRALISGGANPAIKDSAHDSDAFGWAEFFDREDILAILRAPR